jgi:hypothetical protein
MTEAWTDRLVADLHLPAQRLVFPVSRLVVDVERFPDDEDEPMAGRGMGAVYTRLSSGERLRDLGSAAEANRPFAGSIVPAAFWRRDRRVRSMMIEAPLPLHARSIHERGDGNARTRLRRRRRPDLQAAGGAGGGGGYE